MMLVLLIAAIKLREVSSNEIVAICSLWISVGSIVVGAFFPKIYLEIHFTNISTYSCEDRIPP